MKIPLFTQKPRYYVAETMTDAYASWDTLEEALDCVCRHERFEPENEVLGIVRTTPKGRKLVVDKKEL